MNIPYPRMIYALTGADRLTFLQGLLSNDVLPLGQSDGLVYAALLTPQGKYLADMFVLSAGGAIYLDIDAALAPSAVQRLMMYRLRADVQITPAADMGVLCGLGAPPQGALADPRHPALGWRMYGPPQMLAPYAKALPDQAAWDALHIAHVIAQSGIELIANETYLLEVGFDRINGVSFRKGCYVGQEVTARMRHKTELKKGLVRVKIDGAAPIGTPITADERVVGTLYRQSGDAALAYLRYDWAQGEMQAGEARLHWQPEAL